MSSAFRPKGGSGIAPKSGNLIQVASDGTINYVGASGTDSILFNFSGSLAPVTGTSRWYPNVGATVTNISATLETPSLVDTTFSIIVSGGNTSHGTVTVPAGKYKSDVVQITGTSLTAADYITVNVTSGNGGADAYVTLYVVYEANSGVNSPTDPKATANTLGYVKVGRGLQVDSFGTLTTDLTISGLQIKDNYNFEGYIAGIHEAGITVAKAIAPSAYNLTGLGSASCTVAPTSEVRYDLGNGNINLGYITFAANSNTGVFTAYTTNATVAEGNVVSLTHSGTSTFGLTDLVFSIGGTGLASGIKVVGPKGDTGNVGPTGASAYALAVANGFNGTVTQWLASIGNSGGGSGSSGNTSYLGEGYDLPVAHGAITQPNTTPLTDSSLLPNELPDFNYIKLQNGWFQDDYHYSLGLQFAFTFNGVDYGNDANGGVWLGSNGYITFGQGVDEYQVNLTNASLLPECLVNGIAIGANDLSLTTAIYSSSSSSFSVKLGFDTARNMSMPTTDRTIELIFKSDNTIEIITGTVNGTTNIGSGVDDASGVVIDSTYNPLFTLQDNYSFKLTGLDTGVPAVVLPTTTVVSPAKVVEQASTFYKTGVVAYNYANAFWDGTKAVLFSSIPSITQAQLDTNIVNIHFYQMMWNAQDYHNVGTANVNMYYIGVASSNTYDLYVGGLNIENHFGQVIFPTTTNWAVVPNDNHLGTIILDDAGSAYFYNIETDQGTWTLAGSPDHKPLDVSANNTAYRANTNTPTQIGQLLYAAVPYIAAGTGPDSGYYYYHGTNWTKFATAADITSNSSKFLGSGNALPTGVISAGSYFAKTGMQPTIVSKGDSFWNGTTLVSFSSIASITPEMLATNNVIVVIRNTLADAVATATVMPFGIRMFYVGTGTSLDLYVGTPTAQDLVGTVTIPVSNNYLGGAPVNSGTIITDGTHYYVYNADISGNAWYQDNSTAGNSWTYLSIAPTNTSYTGSTHSPSVIGSLFKDPTVPFVDTVPVGMYYSLGGTWTPVNTYLGEGMYFPTGSIAYGSTFYKFYDPALPTHSTGMFTYTADNGWTHDGEGLILNTTASAGGLTILHDSDAFWDAGNGYLVPKSIGAGGDFATLQDFADYVNNINQVGDHLIYGYFKTPGVVTLTSDVYFTNSNTMGNVMVGGYSPSFAGGNTGGGWDEYTTLTITSIASYANFELTVTVNSDALGLGLYVGGVLSIYPAGGSDVTALGNSLMYTGAYKINSISGTTVVLAYSAPNGITPVMASGLSIEAIFSFTTIDLDSYHIEVTGTLGNPFNDGGFNNLSFVNGKVMTSSYGATLVLQGTCNFVDARICAYGGGYFDIWGDLFFGGFSNFDLRHCEYHAEWGTTFFGSDTAINLDASSAVIGDLYCTGNLSPVGSLSNGSSLIIHYPVVALEDMTTFDFGTFPASCKFYVE